MAVMFVTGTSLRVESQDVARISTGELRAKLDDPQLIVLDVRSAYDWDRSQAKIPGAIRVDPRRTDWADDYSKDNTLVFYCT
jgi:rhodanese-related sulfurtransferase